MRVLFDEERALVVFKILDEEWRAKRGIFANIVLPQDRLKMPKGKEQIVNFLFYSALFMRGGIISEDPFRWVTALYDKRPEYFDPSYVVKKGLAPDDLTKAFLDLTPKVLAQNSFVKGRKENGSGTPFAYKIKEHTKGWIINSKFFVKKFNGNILSIFDGVKDFEEAFGRINLKDRKNNGGHGIFGMRRKIFSLFTIWLQEKALIPLFPTPIPVDFHAMRILSGTRIMLLPDTPHFKGTNPRHPKSYEGKEAFRVSEDFVDIITKWSQVFLAENNLSHLVINPALWVLSRDLCANHFQNSTKNKGTVFMEPEHIRSGRLAWPKGYVNPCAACPIEQYCADIAPAAPYYIWGLLMKMKRVPCPLPPFQTQTVLPGLGVEEVHPVLGRVRRRTKK